MDTEYEKSRLERTKRGLYKPGEEAAGEKHVELSPSRVDVENDWGDTEIITDRKERSRKPGVTFFLKMLVLAAVLTAAASGAFLLYQYFDPLRQVSDKNILITFETPVGVNPGVPADIVVHIANQNRVGLEYANLTLFYPSGTRDGANSDKDLRDQKKVLGVIKAGESIEFRGSAIFLGEENETKDVRAVLEYRFEGVNSILTKEESRPIRLLAAPVNLVVNALKEINSGQRFDLAISAISNTVIPLRDVFVVVEYPQGFTYTGAEPKPTFGNNIWRIGTLSPSGKFPVVITGILEGADTEQRVFHTNIGVGSNKTEREIATLYGKVVSEVTVKRPFIGITLAINGKPAGDALASYGSRIEGVITWKNNLPTRIINAQIEVSFRGTALDRSSVGAANGGFYRSLDNTIFWDERGDPTLTALESGESGAVHFFLTPLPAVAGNQVITNPVITAEVTVRGKRLSDDPTQVPEEIKTVMSQTVRMSSEAQFVARGVHFVGPFVNSGPIPPKVEQETTYTIIWSVVNTSNNIVDARVRGVIPPYVKWYGAVSPSTEKVSYDPTTNEIIWLPGSIPAGTGITKPPREVAFQIVILPSLSQVSFTPVLISGMQLTATDSFTNTEIVKKVKDVTIELPSDPKAPPESGIVVE